MAAPWTQHYDAGVPESLAPYPPKTLVDYARDNAAAAARRSGHLLQGNHASRTQTSFDLSDRFAAALVDAGVRRGDRVALLLPNCPQFVIAELGAWKAGATVLPLNPLYTSGELIDPLRTAGVKIVVTLTLVLQTDEGDSGADVCESDHRDQHQGISAARFCACCSRCSRKRRAGTGWRSSQAMCGFRIVWRAGQMGRHHVQGRRGPTIRRSC